MGYKKLCISAPSGAGKTTIIQHLLSQFDQLDFAVSVTTRKKREDEVHGKDYYFETVNYFRELRDRDEFVEWEEVYPGTFYGTLRSEIQDIEGAGKMPLFDLDVFGGQKIKKVYPDETLTVMIIPASMELLTEHLTKRERRAGRDPAIRLARVPRELAEADKFDLRVVNTYQREDLDSIVQQIMDRLLVAA